MKGISRAYKLQFVILGCAWLVGCHMDSSPLTTSSLNYAGWEYNAQQVAASSFSTPILSNKTLEATEIAIDRYRNIVANGGWQRLENTAVGLSRGKQSKDVIVLRRRLTVTGDLDDSRMVSNEVFDSYVVEAVKHYQMRNGLVVNGKIDQATWKALNVSADDRLAQLQVNLKRLQTLVAKTTNSPKYVVVNIPDNVVEAVKNQQVERRFTAIVGRKGRQTPELSSQIYNVTLNPTWTVPKSIIEKDLLPILQEDPNYLVENNIFVYDNKGNKLDPKTIDWHGEAAKTYRYRQEAGKNSAMASTKLNFLNNYEVYMHDTPVQNGFIGADMMYDSSGCIRVQNIRDLDEWLLDGQQGWTRQAINKRIESGKTTIIGLKQKVPLHLVYISAWSKDGAIVQFRNDIYKKDNVN